MKKSLSFFCTILIFLNTGFSQPPAAEKKNVNETIFGINISDPYRYLENLTDTSVESWYRQQAAYAKAQLNKFPDRQKIMQDFFSFGRNMTNLKASMEITDKYLIYLKVINPMNAVFEYHLIDRKANKDTLLFRSNDPAIMDTSQYRLEKINLSPDEQLLCLEGNKKDGSEFQCLRFYHIPSMKILPDKVFKKFRRWMPDSRSIAVLAVQTTDIKSDKLYENTAIEIYTIGKDGLVDIFSARSAPHLKLDPKYITRITTNTESSYIAGSTVSVSSYIHNIYFAPLGNYNIISRAWKPILFPRDSVTDIVNSTNIIIYGDYIYYKSASGNPNYTLRRVSIPSGKKEVIVNDREGILHDFTIVNDRLYYVLRNGLQCQLFVSSLKDIKNRKQVILPKEGMVSIETTKGNKRVLLTIRSWTSFTEEYLFNPDDQSWTINPLHTNLKLPWQDKVESKEVWVTARDGTKVPLTLIYPKDLKLDGQNPALIYGYGSYGDSEFPSVNPIELFQVSKGIIKAIAHVRGGGELGDQWHLAGMKKTKSNTWNDFIDCAEWLIENKYTSPSRLIGEGSSAGGVLIGRAITERPDLFCGAIINVGLMNASRFAFTPNGANHFDEFGNPSINEEFKSLYEMDAYLHIKDKTAYPAIYITAGWNDARVIAWQPGKFAARIQNSTTSGKPVYFIVNFDAGHFQSLDPLNDIINRIVFLYQQWDFNPFGK